MAAVRARVLAVAVMVITVAAIAATGYAVASGSEHAGRATGIVRVDVARLRPGGVVVTGYRYRTRPDEPGAPVLVAETYRHTYLALIGVSTHLGCRVEWVHASGYRRFEHFPQVAFEDPCGGSLFALDGSCIGGPCPRGLDRIGSSLVDAHLQIDLRDRVPGAPRDPSSQLDVVIP